VFFRIGKEELMVDEYGDDDIEYELAPVSAQLAYVHQVIKSGKFLPCK
jgi:signal recognition particle subunit SRP72